MFTGTGFGYVNPEKTPTEPVTGEVVFNTSMTGYQEILTDPSYCGQIVTMTYPLIGNYGVNVEDVESTRVQVSGFVVRELANRHSNYRASTTLETWLADQRVLGISGIDTRALTRKLRITGAMSGVLVCETYGQFNDAELVDMARAVPSMTGQNLAQQVSTKTVDGRDEGLGNWSPIQGLAEKSSRAFRVVTFDCGAKSNILRHLVDCGCEVVVMPHDSSATQVLAEKPDGIFVSNGPGDPEPVDVTIATLRELMDSQPALPMFGICLGHQLLALALGAKTFKLKFGHRGGNQPVQNLATGKVEITSQNHGFAVETESLKQVDAEPTHVNLNDNTLAGFRHRTRPIFAVQYHPEASPGPHDASYLFDCFIQMMETSQSPTSQQMDQAQRRRNTLLNVTDVAATV